MATMQELQSVNWPMYITRFLDSNAFNNSLEAAEAIGAQVRADFGPCDTMLVEIEAGCEWNRRAATAEARRRADEWLGEHRAAFGPWRDSYYPMAVAR